jgi:hypothetical protein
MCREHRARRQAPRGLRALCSAALVLLGCGGNTGLRMTDGTDFHAYVQSRSGGASGGELARVRFRPSLCDGEAMQPEHALLDENNLVEFLTRQHLDVTVDRPRADLVYLNIAGAGTDGPVRMRVAILENADQAGTELHEALLQHGEGAWGVHRSNLAALVPVGPYSEAIAFAAKTKLACWGVFTAAGTDDTFVVPGGYLEL